jgi:hypothetical protein
MLNWGVEDTGALQPAKMEFIFASSSQCANYQSNRSCTMQPLLRALLCLSLLLPISAFADSQLRGLAVDAQSMPTSVDEPEEQAYWDELANTGTNFLRLQYSNQSVLLDETAYRAWMAEVLEHLDLIIPIAASYDMKVMFSLHSPPGGRDESGSRPIDRIFMPEYAWAKQVMIDFWSAAAAKYNGNSTVAVYLIMGEPAPVEKSQWKEFSAILVNTIRGTGAVPIAEQPAIAISSIYGNPALATTISIPQDGGKYMASFNMYFPWKYTHQGLFDDKVYSYPAGSSADARPSMRARSCKKIKNPKKKKKCRKKKKEQKQGNGKKTGKKKKPNALTKAGLVNSMKKFLRFALNNNVEVLIGEYSVVAYAPGAATYLTDLTDIFNDNGFHSAYHIWDEAPVWSLQHDCTNKSSCTLSESPNDRMQVMQNFFSNNASD